MITLKDLVNSKDWYKAEIGVTIGFSFQENYQEEDLVFTVKQTDNFFNPLVSDNSLPVSLGKSPLGEVTLDLSKELLKPVPTAVVNSIEVIEFHNENSQKQILLESEHLTLEDLKNKMESWETAVIVYKQKAFEQFYTECERSYEVSSSCKFFQPAMSGNGLFGKCLGSLDYCKLSNYNWEIDYCYITKLK